MTLLELIELLQSRNELQVMVVDKRDKDNEIVKYIIAQDLLDAKINFVLEGDQVIIRMKPGQKLKNNWR